MAVCLMATPTNVWAACVDRKVRVYDIQSRECVHEIDVSDQTRLNSLSLIDQSMWGLFDNGTIVVWDVEVRNQQIRYYLIYLNIIECFVKLLF
jgi:WD40 repeat protein